MHGLLYTYAHTGATAGQLLARAIGDVQYMICPRNGRLPGNGLVSQVSLCLTVESPHTSVHTTSLESGWWSCVAVKVLFGY